MRSSRPPTVSAIIPVYNGQQYLREAIDSILGGDYQPIELIVIDDGSSDDSASIAKSYGHRVQYYYQPNSGVSAAQNKGIELALGDFISFLDCDDLWVTEKTTLQLCAFASNPAIDMVFGHVQQFYSPELSATLRAQHQYPVEVMPGYSTGTMLLKRDAFSRVGRFSTEFRVGEFVDWYAKATDSGLQSLMLPDILLKRRIHANNMGIRDQDKRTDYLRVLKASLDRRRRMNRA